MENGRKNKIVKVFPHRFPCLLQWLEEEKRIFESSGGIAQALLMLEYQARIGELLEAANELITSNNAVLELVRESPAFKKMLGNAALQAFDPWNRFKKAASNLTDGFEASDDGA